MASGKENKGLKNVKFIFFTLISIMIIFPATTRAESIINHNGVVISEQEYNDFLKVYDDNYIMHMSADKYNKLKNYDFDDINTTTKYYETTYNQSLNLTTEREITKNEFDSFNPINARLSDGGASHETQAKKITLTVIGGSIWNNIITVATWKGIPGTRSYDVIGFRGYGFEFGDGTQSGEQIYTLNGNYTVIDYAWNGTNIKKFDNGFGISMNIVNSDITYLQLILEGDISPLIDHPTIYASYQHAQQELSLADSQNYTLGGAGLGSVFVYPYSIAQKYDGMSGVNVGY